VAYVRRLTRNGESVTIGGLIRVTLRNKDSKRWIVIDAPPNVRIEADDLIADDEPPQGRRDPES
jgi:hypothetical protein